MENENSNWGNEVQISYEGKTITAIIEMANKKETRTACFDNTWIK